MNLSDIFKTHFLKLLYDEYRERIKLVVTGSSAFYIDEKFKDSLVGRKRIFELKTLDFDLERAGVVAVNVHIKGRTNFPQAYSTPCKNNPDGGAVNRAGSREYSTKKPSTCSSVMFPRPTSTSTPMMRRTIFQRKCEP